MKKLSSIAKVSFGINYSPNKLGDIPLIQSRSIDESGAFNPLCNSGVHSGVLAPKDYLRQGDLLFAAKGDNNYPYVVKAEDLPAVASSVFFIIRVNRKLVLPGYLAWYLKSPESRHWMNTISEGSTISSISIKEFRKFKIPVPDLEVQKKVVELQYLQECYKKIVEKLAAKTELLNREISKRLIDEHNE